MNERMSEASKKQQHTIVKKKNNKKKTPTTKHQFSIQSVSFYILNEANVISYRWTRQIYFLNQKSWKRKIPKHWQIVKLSKLSFLTKHLIPDLLGSHQISIWKLSIISVLLLKCRYILTVVCSVKCLKIRNQNHVSDCVCLKKSSCQNINQLVCVVDH